MGVYKTVNGAYRYSLMPTYYVKGCSPLALPLGELSPQVTERALALPLGELSPQVTERVLRPFSNDKINLFTHITEIPVYIPVGESQNLHPKRHQELRTFSIISKPLRFVMLRAIQFNDKSGRSAVKVHLVWSLVTLSVLAALGHLSQRERQDVFPGTFPLRALAALGHLSQRERQDVFPGTFPLRALAALGHLSQRERQGMLARYTERCIEVRPLSVRQIGVYCSIR